MAYKVTGRDLRWNGKVYSAGDTVPIPAGDGDVLVSRGRLRKVAARPTTTGTASKPTAKAEDNK